ncbi:MAG: galactokinase [Pseudomonadota bacterium]
MSIEKKFEETFSRQPSGVASAPGRVNLIGEHIDYNGGTVLPTALNKRTSIAIAPNGTQVHTIHSDRFAPPVTRSIEEPANDHWSDYIVGAFACANALGWTEDGLDIFVESNLPDGAGVSSSAALVTAALRAAMHHADAALDPKDLAKQARSVENSYIGVPCGIMDQMAVGMLAHGEALILDTRSVETEIVQIPRDWSFVTLHTGVHRQLADGRYKERFQECASAAAALGARWLCHLSDEQTKKVRDLSGVLGKRANHVVSEHRRTIWAVGAMRAGDINTFGRLMRESHRSYSDEFEASTPEIDAMVDSAVELGAIGSRLTGGGFGGCIVSLLPRDAAESWTADMLSRHPEAQAV